MVAFENKTSHENESEVVWFRTQFEQIQQKRIEKKCKFADLSCLIWKQRTRHFVILQVIPAEERQNYNKGTTL